jgi:DNA helicase IV
MTLLGDLAQGSGVWAHDRWDDLLSYLGAPAGIRRAELRLGYRAPAQVLTLASQLLAEAAPHIRTTMAVRPGRSQPSIRRSARADALAADAVKEAQELGRRYGSVAIVCASPSAAALAAALDDARLWWGAAAEGRLDRTFTLVVGVGAKGLEFDAAVVVEPAEFVDDAPHGLRLLYVALTRPTQHLSIAHWLALPEALSRDPTAA